MNPAIILFRYYLVLVLLFILLPLATVLASGANSVLISTYEREPYIGEKLPKKGYVHEVVVEAFRRSGYQANLQFYPLAY